jgi:hypothetical protein
MNPFRVPLLILTIPLFVACGGDYRDAAIGGPSEVMVVLDSNAVIGPIGKAIDQALGRYILTMPRSEPKFDIRYRDLRTRQNVEQVQKHKNLMLVSHLQDSTNVGRYVNGLVSEGIKERVRNRQQHLFTLKDRWYRDQWIMIILANDATELAEVIQRNGDAIANSLYEVELPRHDFDVYRRGDQPVLADSLFRAFGWTLRIQHDYRLGIDTANFVSLRRWLDDNDRWIWVHWIDGVPNIESVNRNVIHATRDSLLKIYFQGTREGAYVTTDFRRDNSFRFMTMNGRPTFESKGSWVMNDFSMGGPFVSYVMYDEAQRRLYFLDFGQFAPKYKLRRFVYQFEAIARTFRTASDPA